MNVENSRYIFAPHSLPTLPIRGPDKPFPAHRIYCVGRNYAEHAIEMGHDPNREAPPRRDRRGSAARSR